jgi:DDE domain
LCAVTRSCRTSDAATTNSASTRALTGASSTRSPNSPIRSEPETTRQLGPARHGWAQRNSARKIADPASRGCFEGGTPPQCNSAAVDQYGQIIDVYVSARRDTKAARRFFATALDGHGKPTEVITDRAGTLLAVVDELMPDAFHNTSQYANNRIEADHGRLKARLCPMRGLKRDHTARVIVRGHAFMQNLRRGHYELGVEARAHRRVAMAFTELARTI